MTYQFSAQHPVIVSMVTCQNNNSVYFSPNEKYFSLHEKYLDTRPRCRNRKSLHVWWHVFSNGQKHSFTLSITPGDVGEEKWMSCRAQILMTGNICIINPLLWHTLNTARATTTSALHCWNWFCNTASQTVESSQIVSTRDGLFLYLDNNEVLRDWNTDAALYQQPIDGW